MQTETLTEPIEEVQNSFGLVQDKLSAWLDIGVALLPNLVVAIVVILAFGLLARLARSLTRRFLVKVSGRKTIASLLSTVVGIVVVFIGVFIALGVLQLDKTVTSLLAGAGVVGIALAFAFQDLAANLIAGVYVSFQRPFVIDDVIETNDTFGIVEAIDLRTTVLRSTSGQRAMIPNKEIFENKLVNFSTSGTRRVALAVGVSYDEDLEMVRDIAKEAISDLELRDTHRDVEIFYTGFGGSSIDFEARFWIDFSRQVEYKNAMSEAIIAIKKAFDARGITIPFPIRTLELGAEDRERLSDTFIKSLSAGEVSRTTDKQGQQPQ